MEEERSLHSARRKVSVPSDVPRDVHLRVAASRGKLHEVRTLLANGAAITKDTVSAVVVE